jgi:hypothetical protein
MPKDIADLTRKVGSAAKALSPKPVKLLKPIGTKLTHPIGSLKVRGLSLGAEDAFGVSKFNRRTNVKGVLGGKATAGGLGARSFAGKGRVKSFR